MRRARRRFREARSSEGTASARPLAFALRRSSPGRGAAERVGAEWSWSRPIDWRSILRPTCLCPCDGTCLLFAASAPRAPEPAALGSAVDTWEPRAQGTVRKRVAAALPLLRGSDLRRGSEEMIRGPLGKMNCVSAWFYDDSGRARCGDHYQFRHGQFHSKIRHHWSSFSAMDAPALNFAVGVSASRSIATNFTS